MDANFENEEGKKRLFIQSLQVGMKKTRSQASNLYSKSFNLKEVNQEMAFNDLNKFLSYMNLATVLKTLILQDEEGCFLKNEQRVTVKVQKLFPLKNKQFIFKITSGRKEKGKRERSEESKEESELQEIDYEQTLHKYQSRENSGKVLSKILQNLFQAQYSKCQVKFLKESQPLFASKRKILSPKYESLQFDQLHPKAATPVKHKFLFPSPTSSIETYLKVENLIYMYASPLCLKQKGKGIEDIMRTIDELDFQKELREIQSELEGIKKEISIESVHGTINNLTKVLQQQGPVALHFTGHGIPNTEENFGPQYRCNRDIRFYLLMEQEDGEGILLSDTWLKEQLSCLKKNLGLVFISSCYSEFAGQVFRNAGVKHVICVKQKYQVKDKAALAFAKRFYHSIFSENMTICQAFTLAQNFVRASWGTEEGGKFQLLRDEKEEEGSHQCLNVYSLREGSPRFIEPTPAYLCLPPKCLDLIGRKKAISEVVQNTFKHRLFVQMGLIGSGKSSVAKNALHFIAARNMFEAGILYYNLKGCKESKIMIKQLLVKLVLTEKDFTIMKRRGAQNLLLQVLGRIAQREKKLLIMFDNAEDVIGSDRKHFWALIYKMLDVCQCLHVLITTTMLNNEHVGPFKKDVGYNVKYLPQLTEQQSLELFKKVARPFSMEEENELLQYGETGRVPRIRLKNLSGHKLFKLLGGNPQAIILASIAHQKMSLKQLFEQLSSPSICTVMKNQDASLEEIAQVSPIDSSLEFSLCMLEKESPLSLDLFYLLALLPGGIEQSELFHFYGSQTNFLLQRLWEYSLVQKKEEGSKKLELSQIMSIHAIKRIPPPQKLSLQSAICLYYQLICRSLLEKNGEKKCSHNKWEREQYSKEQMKALLEHEQNIHAAIVMFTEFMREEEIKRLRELEHLHRQGLEELIKKAPTSQSHQLKPLKTFLHADSMKKTANLYLQRQNRQKSSLKGEQQNEELKEIDCLSLTDELENLEEQKEEKRKKNVKIEIQKTESLGQVTLDMEVENQNNSFRENSQMLACKFNNLVHFKSQHEAQEQEAIEEECNNKERKSLDSDSLKSDSDIEQSIVLSDQEKLVQTYIQQAIIESLDKHSRIQVGINSILLRTDLDKIKDYEKDQTHTAFDRINTVAQRRKTTAKPISEGVFVLHPAESLIIDYLMNLFLMDETDYSLQFIEETAKQIKGSDLYQANLLRIEGMLWNNKLNYKEAIGCLSAAKKLYLRSKSVYGVALVNFAIGYMYYNNITQLVYDHEAEKIFAAAQIFFQNSWNQFKALNHLLGMSVCCKYLSKVASNFRHFQEAHSWIVEYQTQQELFKKSQLASNSKKAHVQRIHGKDVSLLSEQVYDTDNSDLFKRQKAKGFGESGEAMQNQKLDYLKEVNIEDNNVQEAEQFMQNMSLAVAIQLVSQMQNIYLNKIQGEQISRFLDEENVIKQHKMQFCTLSTCSNTLIKKTSCSMFGARNSSADKK